MVHYFMGGRVAHLCSALHIRYSSDVACGLECVGGACVNYGYRLSLLKACFELLRVKGRPWGRLPT